MVVVVGGVFVVVVVVWRGGGGCTKSFSCQTQLMLCYVELSCVSVGVVTIDTEEKIDALFIGLIQHEAFQQMRYQSSVMHSFILEDDIFFSFNF